MTARTLRIFLSSPGDVGLERDLATRVVERLQGEFAARVNLSLFRWEHEPVLATSTFQDQIVPPSQTDIVVCILWSRLGTRLPAQYRREDGTPYASGTEWEFEDAARARRERGIPDLLVYRKSEEPYASLRDKEKLREQERQWEALESFVRHWFIGDDGSFKAGLKTFREPDEFEAALENDLRKLILARLPRAGAGEGEHAAPVRWHRGSPYRGLKAFEFEHAPVFFGRTRAIGEIKERLARQAAEGRAFLLVLGMSGCGKSSLVRAGVLPTITRPGVIEGVGAWRYCVLRPSDEGGDPCASLASALLSPSALPELAEGGVDGPKLAGLLRDAPQHAVLPLGLALARAADAMAAREHLTRPPETRLIVVVDQFEELFTLEGLDPARREQFVAALSALSRSGRAWVIAAMRSDFYPHCAEISELLALKEGSGQYDLLPPTFAEIAQIISHPTRAAGLRFESSAGDAESLDRRLHEAAARDAEALPLLEFTLERLYEERSEDGVLLFAAYERMGGLEGALARHAEEAYQDLGLPEREALPAVLRSLVTVRHGDETLAAARRVPRDEIDTSPERKAVVDALVRARLLVTDRAADGRAEVRLAHEALLRHWPRLQQWLDDDRDFLRVRARVEEAAARWRHEGRSADFLLTGVKPLAEAEDLFVNRRADLDDRALEFIRASLANRARGRRRRGLAVVGLTAAITAAALIAAFQWQAHERNRHERKKIDFEQTFASADADVLAGYQLTIARNLIPDDKQLAAMEALLGTFEKCLALALELAGDPRESPEVWKKKALQSYDKIVELRLVLRDTDGARRALADRKKLAQTLPLRLRGSLRGPGDISSVSAYSITVLELQADLAIANVHLSALARQEALLRDALGETSSGNAAGARSSGVGGTRSVLELLLAARAGAELLVREAPTPESRRRLADLDFLIGESLLDMKDPQRAEEYYGKCLAIRSELVHSRKAGAVPSLGQLAAGATGSGAAARLHELVTVRLRIGDLMLDRGKPGDALAAYQKGVDELLAIPTAQRGETLVEDLFSAYFGVAAAQAGLKDSAKAFEALSKGAEAAAGHDRTAAAGVLARLLRRYETTADARRRLGDSRGAEADDDRRLSLAREFLPIARDRARDRTDLDAHRELASLYEVIGKIQQAKDERKSAGESFMQGAAVFDDVDRDDPAARRARRSHLTKFADLLASLGERKGALALLEKALDTVTAGEATLPGPHPGAPNPLVLLHQSIADLRRSLGDDRGALAALEKALDVASKVTDKSGARDSTDHVARLASLVAQARLERGDAAGARQASETAMSIVLPKTAGTAERRRLAEGYGIVASVRQRLGDHQEAAAAHLAALAAREAIVAAKDDEQSRTELAGALSSYADFLLATRDAPGAVKAAEKRFEVVSRIVPADAAGRARNRHARAQALRAVGMFRRAGGDKPGALAAYEESLAIVEPAAAESPFDAWLACGTYSRIATLRLGMGDKLGARLACDKVMAIDLSRSGLRRDLREDWARYCETVGDCRTSLDDLPGALAAYERARGLDDAIVGESGKPQDRRFLAQVYGSIARTQKRLGNIPAAVEAAGKRLAAYEALAHDPGSNRRDRRALADSYGTLGDLELDLGKVEAALKSCTKAVELYLALDREMSDMQSRRDVALAYLSLGWAELFHRRPAEAIAASRKGLEADPTQVLLYTNLAHGYLFSNQLDKAKPVYLEHREARIGPSQTFAQAVLNDFNEFEARGLRHPDIETIRRLLASPGL